jgi:hypothetical protein
VMSMDRIDRRHQRPSTHGSANGAAYCVTMVEWPAPVMTIGSTPRTRRAADCNLAVALLVLVCVVMSAAK